MTNIQTDQINQVRTLLEQTQEVLIILGRNPSLDNVAGGLALFLSLSSRGKRANIICQDLMTVEFNHLIGVDKIGNNFNQLSSGKNLVISFPYQEGSIEKVSYNIENNSFNLVIEPRDDYPIITPDIVKYSFSGGNAELIITIGVKNLSELGNIYQNNQNFFSNKPLINIDSDNQNQGFGKVNLIDSNVSSTSELMVSILSSLGITIDPDIATNLLAGITQTSNNFTTNRSTALTFEAAAICLKHGAKKVIQTTYMDSTSLPTFQAQTTTSIPFTTSPKPSFQPQEPINKPMSSVKNYPNRPKPIQQQTQKQSHPETPPDWLKPKIYKGSTLL